MGCCGTADLLDAPMLSSLPPSPILHRALPLLLSFLDPPSGSKTIWPDLLDCLFEASVSCSSCKQLYRIKAVPNNSYLEACIFVFPCTCHLLSDRVQRSAALSPRITRGRFRPFLYYISQIARCRSRG